MHVLLLSLIFALSINLIMFVPAFLLQTDVLTDASYAITFIVVSYFAYNLGTNNHVTTLVLAMIWIWALRIGIFLYLRVRKNRKDARFDDMRNHFWRFGRFWLLQGLSVWIILIPALLFFNRSTAALGTWSYVGLGVWAIGLAIETIADLQKSRFTSEVENKGKWISSGLWSWSRHPNYFGEMTIWVGLYLVVSSSLSPDQAILALIGPVYIIGLLRFGSGVPILEKSADERWGKNPHYKVYKHRTGLLIPRPPKS